MQDNYIAFLLLRLAIGASMLGHGLVRLPKLAAFSAWMTGQFGKSMLPSALIKPFSYVLPLAELLIGILLVCGLFTRVSLIGGGVVMVMLIFGTSMIENWEAIPSQLIHAAFFVGLLYFLQYNRLSLDHLFKI